MKSINITKHAWFSRGLLPAVLLAASLLAGSSAIADDKDRCDEGPDGSLAKWNEIYWPWYYSNLYLGINTIPLDANGNAVVRGVVLMPLPNAPGDGTPASIDVTLDAGQPFFLPLWGLVGTSYTDGRPPDPLVSVRIFKTLAITFKVDGKTVVNSANKMDYYSESWFSPPFPLPVYGVDSLIWFESISVAHAPLTPGKHTLTLDAVNTQLLPPYVTASGISEFHNTWNITVPKPARGGARH